MGLLVNAAVGALSAFVGGMISASVVGPNLAWVVAAVFGLLSFFIAASLVKDPAPVQDDWEAREARKKAKKEKRQLEAQKERDEKEKAKEAERLAKEAEKVAKEAEKKAAAKKAAAKQATKKPEPEEDDTPKTKTAAKKAKAAAKKAAEEAEAAAKAAEEAKKAKKKSKKSSTTAAAPAAAAAVTPAPAAVAQKTLEEEGWEIQPVRQPSKKQQQRAEEKKAESTKPVTGTAIPAQHTNLKPVTVDVVVPLKKHPIIIGAGGATLKLLVQGSGAKIEMPKRESGSSKISISGTPDQIALAKNAIESLAERGFSNITHPGTLSDDLSVGPNDIGVIMGSQGSTLKTIQTKLSVRINLPEKGSKSTKVTIVGAKDNVKQAKAVMRQLLADGFSPLTHEGWVKSEIPFPKEKVGILIGPKGHTLKSIQGNTKTKINIPDKTAVSTGPHHVSVCGLPAGVAQAEKEILRLLEPPAPLPDPEEEDIATEEAWGQHHTAQGEDALWE